MPLMCPGEQLIAVAPSTRHSGSGAPPRRLVDRMPPVRYEEAAVGVAPGPEPVGHAGVAVHDQGEARRGGPRGRAAPICRTESSAARADRGSALGPPAAIELARATAIAAVAAFLPIPGFTRR